MALKAVLDARYTHPSRNTHVALKTSAQTGAWKRGWSVLIYLEKIKPSSRAKAHVRREEPCWAAMMVKRIIRARRRMNVVAAVGERMAWWNISYSGTLKRGGGVALEGGDSVVSKWEEDNTPGIGGEYGVEVLDTVECYDHEYHGCDETGDDGADHSPWYCTCGVQAFFR